MRLKKIITVFLIVSLMLLSGCSDEKEPFKIGIITETVNYGNEEFFTTEKLSEKYSDIIIPEVYPDNYITASSVTNSKVLSLAENPEVKAIIFADAVAGVNASIDLVLKARPDLLIISCNPEEDIDEIASKSDIVFTVDSKAISENVVSKAKSMGATSFVFYSYDKHLYYQNILDLRESVKSSCISEGLTFVEVMVPDPNVNAELTESFIKENIASQVSVYGKDIAFFGTACALQVPIIESVLSTGAIFPGQCCPSPYHSYPEALGLDLYAYEGLSARLYEDIAAKLSEHGQESRMSTWSVPSKALMIEAGAAYALMYQKGEITSKNDSNTVLNLIKEISKGKGSCRIESGNIYHISSSYIDFSKVKSGS